MVVGAVEHIVPAEGIPQVNVRHVLPGEVHGLLNGGPVVHQGCPVGQAVGPHVALVRDEGEVHRYLHIGPQLVDVAHPTGQVVLRWLGVLGKEGLAIGAQVDPVVLLLAHQPLAPGLELNPAVPQGELVDDVLLKVLHKLAGLQGGQCGGLELGQIAVLLLGEVPVGGDQQRGPKAKDEHAEESGNECSILFTHSGSPP